MKGVHYLIDYKKLTFEFLEDLENLKKIFEKTIKISKTKILHKKFHKFKPQGLTGIYLLSESHLSFHTWPENGEISIDLYTCGNCDAAQLAVDYLIDKFNKNKDSKYKIKKVIR
jgi:S-adenosylmethionine decarboxylase